MAKSVYSETLNGLRLKIVADNDGSTECPFVHDPAIVFASYSRRNGATFYAPDAIKSQYELKTPEGAIAFTRDHLTTAEGYKVFALWAYIHSGTVYRAAELGAGNPFVGTLAQGHAEFDSGRAGIIAIKLDEIGDTDPFKVAEQALENYNAWCNGEIYGYVVEDENGAQLDSCWGFIGPANSHVLSEGKRVLAALAAKHVPALPDDKKILALGDALKLIVFARDFHAEHGRYPTGGEIAEHPAPDQAFDDWAADIADRALTQCAIAKLALDGAHTESRADKLERVAAELGWQKDPNQGFYWHPDDADETTYESLEEIPGLLAEVKS